MSLFKSRDWWSVNLNEIEMFDSNCLLVTTLGNDKHQCIALGSHNGFFRLYSPSSSITEDGTIAGFKPSDLLVEFQLQYPILQLAVGALVSGSQDKFLAILHPRLLSIFTFGRKENTTDVSDQIAIELAYQHQLRHSAYSFVIGPFGGGRGRDFVCVQSLDGLLSFYEQESLVFHIYLPQFLLPGTFIYIEKIDCFLFLNASLTLDCYSYEALASAGNADESQQKKIPKHWEHNIGETILDIIPIVNDGLNILILSERNLYNLNENGSIIFMKRLEYKPTCFRAYVTAEAKKLMILISSDSCFLYVYESTCLKWCSKIDQAPVAISRVFLSNLSGGLVMLSEDGLLQCIYLGTHPSIYLIPPMAQPEINIHETELELKQLQSEILENDVIDPLVEESVTVTLSIDMDLKNQGAVKICEVGVEVNTQSPINKLQILFIVDPPLRAAKASHMISTCCDKVSANTLISLQSSGIVSNLALKIVVSYVNNNGVPFVVEKNGSLPLAVAVESAGPTKEATHKLTIITNKPVCPMNVVFGEFDKDEASSNVIGLKYLNSDVIVTILAAKSSQRYRLQSDHMDAITLILETLISRLKKYFQKVPDFNLSYSSALPLHIYFENIDQYFSLIKKKKTMQEQLGRRTCQYRTIQKKVLINLKDVTPKPASNLHKILRDTYEMIMASIQDLEIVENDLEICRCSISSLSRLQVSLLELMTISAKDLTQLRIVFNPNMHDTDEQGWLEVQGAAASFFLRTSLAKSTRDQQKATDITLSLVSDTSKTFKHFSAVIDRVTKGTHLLERNEFENEREVIPTVSSFPEQKETLDMDVIPVGSKLVDLQNPSFLDQLPVKREKRLKKQGRVDSIGSTIDTKVNLDGVIDEANLAPGTITVETVATIETPLPSVEVKAEATPEELDFLPEEIRTIDKPLEKIIDPIEDDAIWDLKVDEMRI